MYRSVRGFIEVFLVHPGGPFFKNKDVGAWTLPKGLQEKDEDLLLTAQREFEEETGIKPLGPYFDLGTTRLKSGKVIYAWAFETEAERVTLQSNTFTMEWPPRSGKQQTFPEVDKADFFNLEQAREKLNEAQGIFLDRLAQSKRF